MIRLLPAVVMLLLGAGAARQEGQATFATNVDTVATFVTVLDADGRPVTGLAARDFEIRDNGRARPITQFEPGPIPITIVLLLDDSPSLRASSPGVVAAAEAFVGQMGEADRATVGTFNRIVRIEGLLTNDRQELRARLVYPARLIAGSALWDALHAGMSVLEEEAGRRAILVLSDGDDNSSEMTQQAIAERARRDNILIYAVGIRGAGGRLSASLRELARDSGGTFVELKSSDNLAVAFRSVAEELRHQYLLGFPVEVFDGMVHRLDVKVKRRGVTVRARRSYHAAR